ncbi:MAG: outer membrane beta-barrel protein, partial [Desulfobacterales bacterium]|nr:outer membrane beta-barrel protein [Desulfobacterales bacterium]
DDFRIPDDRMLQTPFATLAYWFNIKNGIELNYELEKADFRRKDDFEPRDDYTGNWAEIRYLYRFTPHTTGSVRYDYTTREFDGVTEDYALHEGSMGLEHAFSPDLSVTLAGGYIVQKNEYSKDKSAPSYEGSLTKTFARGSFTVGAESGVDELVLDEPGQGITRFWRANAAIEYQLLEPLRGYAGLFYRRNEGEEERKWQTWTGNCGLVWEFLRWYSLSLDYTYTDRDYEVDELGYTVNQVMLRLTASRLFRW